MLRQLPHRPSKQAWYSTLSHTVHSHASTCYGTALEYWLAQRSQAQLHSAPVHTVHSPVPHTPPVLCTTAVTCKHIPNHTRALAKTIQAIRFQNHPNHSILSNWLVMCRPNAPNCHMRTCAHWGSTHHQFPTQPQHCLHPTHLLTLLRNVADIGPGSSKAPCCTQRCTTPPQASQRCISQRCCMALAAPALAAQRGPSLAQPAAPAHHII